MGGRAANKSSPAQPDSTFECSDIEPSTFISQDWFPWFQSLNAPSHASILFSLVCPQPVSTNTCHLARYVQPVQSTATGRMCAERVSVTKQAPNTPTHHQPQCNAKRTHTPTIEARHLQFISTLALPGYPVLVCRRPSSLSPGPHHPLTDQLPHLDRHTPPLVPFNSNRSLISIPLQHFCLYLFPVHTHTHPHTPPPSQPTLVGPGFCCFCLCIQLAYATSPRLSKDPVNGWPSTVQYETPWVGLAWSVKRRRHVCVNE